MNWIKYLTLVIAAISCTSGFAEKLDVSYATIPPVEGEIWFTNGGIDFSAMEGEHTCVVRDAGHDLYGADSGTSRGNVNIPAFITEDGITYEVVGIKAFRWCGNLLSIEMPASIKWINGIEVLTPLKNLNIPEGVEELKGCVRLENLTYLSLPSTLTSIEGLTGMPELRELQVAAREPYTLSDYAFADTPVETCTLIVPDGCAEAYRKAPKWREFGAIKEVSEVAGITDIHITSDLRLSVGKGCLTVSGYKGKLSIHTPAGQTVYDRDVDDDTSIELPSGAYIVRTPSRTVKIVTI